MCIYFPILDTTDTLWTCAWSSNGKILGVSGGDKTIRLYTFHGSDLQLTNELKGAHSKSIRCVSFCPRRMKLAAASFDGTVSIWSGSTDGNLMKWNCAATLDGHENEVKSVSWGVFLDEHAEEEQVFLSTCGRDKTVWIWTMEDSLEAGEEEDDFECLAVLQEHDQDVKCLAWHPNRPLFLTGSYDESILAFGPINSSLDDWICVGKVARDLRATVWSLAFSPTGQELAVALSTGKLVLYTVPEDGWTDFAQWTRKDVQIFENIPIEEGGGCVNDSEGCASTSNSSCCKSKSSETEHEHEANCSESESESESGCCGGGGSSNKMQVDSCCSSNKKPRTLSVSIPAVELYSVSWNSTGNLLAVACSDHSIRIFDANGSTVEVISEAHEGEVNCLAWTRNDSLGDILASVGDDGKLKVWQIQN